MVKSRADNSGQNGFQFQTVAAISLLLDYLHDFTKIKNEHTLEDIVLMLSDGDCVLAQAKSSHDDEESTNALKYLKKGLITLNEASQKEIRHKLVYITNIRSMLGSKTLVDDYISGKTIWFSDMSKSNKEMLMKNAPSDFDFDAFGIQFLKYIGDDSKEQWILEKMRETFSEYPYLRGLRYNEVYKTWLIYLSRNASKKNPQSFLNKDEMIWGMIVHRVNAVIEDISNESDIDYDGVDINYSLLIESLSGRFQTVSRIYGDYQNIKRTDSSITDSSSFVMKYWDRYTDLISDKDYEQNIKMKIIQNLVETVIRKQDLLLNIRKEFDL